MRSVRSTLRAMKVLVVGPTNNERLRIMDILVGLATPGELELEEAHTKEAALAKFRRDHSDLILVSTDAMESLGREIASAVREEEGIRHTGLIFIDHGSTNDDSLSVMCLELGADDFLRHGASASELMARVRAVLRLKAMTDELRTVNHQLRILSMTDELTGLANMRSFNQSFGDIIRRCRSGETAIAIIMMDLDHFKAVNDTTNHLIGSFVLKEVGLILREPRVLGHGDVPARYGGDEFIMLCEAPTLAEASRRAESVRSLVEAKCFERDGCKIRLTASLGVAWAKSGFKGRAEDLIKAADLMLYGSKEQGRNRVSGMVLTYPTDLSSRGTARAMVSKMIDNDYVDASAVLSRR